MAKLNEEDNLFRGELTKHDDWGGPIYRMESGSTVEYEAAAGSSVQEFVKQKLEERVGYIHDTSKGKLYLFADKENSDTYIQYGQQHPEEEEKDYPEEIKKLKIGELNSFSNYNIEIEYDEAYTKPINAILLGKKDNYIKFNVSTKDLGGERFNETVNITYTITRNDGSKTLLTHIVSTVYGDNTDLLLVDDYIKEGQNVVSINIVGNSSNAVMNSSIIYQVINLQIDAEGYDISKVYDISNGKKDTVSIIWSVTGSSSVSKHIQWFIDGVEQEPGVIPDGVTTGRITKSFDVSDSTFSGGHHNIQYRAWLIINDKEFYTPTYYKDFIVYDGSDEPIIAIEMIIPIGINPLTGSGLTNPTLYGMTQYSNYNLPIAVYKNENTSAVKTTLDVYYQNGGIRKKDVSYTKDIAKNEIWKSTIVPNIFGSSTVEIKAGNSSYILNSTIEKLNLNIKEDNAGLVLNLRANGKSNDPATREIWEYKKNDDEVYKASFSGFTWSDNSGWKNDELLISNGSSVEINYRPLTTSVKDYGLTFELEFSTYNVANDDAVICKIKDEDENAPGITITASEATFSDNAKDTVSTKFKSNENNRIVFVVDPTTQGKPLMFIYINGAYCGSASYAKQTASFASSKFIKFEGTAQAEIKIRHIRIYDRPLDCDTILNNYILYRNTNEERLRIYNRNNVYTDSGTFDLKAIASSLPIMLLTNGDGDNRLERLMDFKSADKSTPILLKQVQYINNLDPTTNFVIENAQLTCQGTSSMNYPIKNLRLYMKDKAKGKYGKWDLPILHTGTTMDDVIGTWASTPGKGTYSFKSCLKGTSSEGERKPQAVNCWTLKADYAESSSSHNTGVARLWNQVLRDSVLNGKNLTRTRAQQVVMEDTTNNMDVRTCVDGFPIVVFYRTSLDDTSWKFVGKYNFNNDKSTESVFGFCDINGIEYQEYENVESNISEYTSAPETEKEEKTSTFTSEEDYQKYVRDNSGKKEEEPLETIDYINALCAVPYEYSKVYQKAIVMINGTLRDTFYGKKRRSSSAESINNKNYCVEVLSNESLITNYLADTSEFDRDWASGFEFRFPEGENDTETKGGLTNLREFYDWCHSTKYTDDTYVQSACTVVINAETMHETDLTYKQDNEYYIKNGIYQPTSKEAWLYYKKAKFQKEKWDYMDVFKMAAYYSYLLRFGAVDQPVKNSMLTTEGTIAYKHKKEIQQDEVFELSTGHHCKWFFINYDNDTILGLNNDGVLVYNPYILRDTKTSEGYWIEITDPTPEQLAMCRPETGYTSIGELKTALAKGEIPPAQNGDMFSVNGGEVIYKWSDEAGYAYAGHACVLWNNLEADEEFMNIVKDIDNALYNAGLSYNNTIAMFNEKQANKWCEKILNKDAISKYITPYVDKNLNHLGKMQGPRTSHRTWWLNKRFTYLDSKFISGEYKNKFVLMKVNVPAPTSAETFTGLTFTITPTEMMNYGWGITSRSQGQTGLAAEKDEQGQFKKIYFNTKEGGMAGIGLGDVMEIYATPYVSEIDLSVFAQYLQSIDLEGVYNEVLGSKLKRLILGKEGVINDGTDALIPDNFKNLEKASQLEYLDIQGFKKIQGLDITNNIILKELYAYRSGLLALSIANGSEIEKLWLPECYTTLILDGVNMLSKDNIHFENDNISNITNLTIKNCELLKATSFELFENWYNARDGKFINTIVDLEGINWTLDYTDLDIIEDYKNQPSVTFKLMGKVKISSKIEGETRAESIAKVNRIKRIFGENCFIESENPNVLVDCSIPFIIINADKTSMISKINDIINFTCDIYPKRENASTVSYNFKDGTNTRSGVTITTIDNNKEGKGKLSSSELVLGSATTLTIEVVYEVVGHNKCKSEINVTIEDPTYPDHLVISGSKSIYKNEAHEYIVTAYDSNNNVATGTYNFNWNIGPTEIVNTYLVNSGSSSGNTYSIKTKTNQPELSEILNISATATSYNGNKVNTSLEILILNENVIMTKQSNPIAMNVFHSKLPIIVTSETAMRKSEAEAITNEMFGTIFSGVTSNEELNLTELKYFTQLTSLSNYAFADCNCLKSIDLPNRITNIGEYCFKNCNKLSTVNMSDNITILPTGCFMNCIKITDLDLSNIITLNNYSLGNIGAQMMVLDTYETPNKAVIVGSALTNIYDYVFENGEVWGGDNNKINYMMIPKNVSYIGELYRKDKPEAPIFTRGKYIKKFYVDPENTHFCSSKEGILFNNAQQTLYKYPEANRDLDYYGIDDTCLTLAAYSFYNNKLTTIKTGTNNEINEHLFENSKELTKVDLSSSIYITEYKYCMFNNCEKLNEIIFNEQVESVKSYVFGNCGFTALTLPDSIENMDSKSIYQCSKLKTLILPSKLRFNSEVIYENNALESIKLPIFSEGEDDIKYNPDYVYNFDYRNMSLLEFIGNENDNNKHFKIINGVIYGVGANSEIETLVKSPIAKKEYNIPNTVKRLNPYAFYNSKVEELILPEQLEYIGDVCFMFANNLKSIVIPSGVTSLGNSVLFCAEALSSITFNTLEQLQLGGLTLANCPKLSEIKILSNNVANITVAFGTNAGTFRSSITDKRTGSSTAIKKILVPNDLLESYRSNENWNDEIITPLEYEFEGITNNYSIPLMTAMSKKETTEVNDYQELLNKIEKLEKIINKLNIN